MFALELCGFVFQGSYAFRNGFPLDSYMEVFVLLAQNFIIVALMFRYTTGINAKATVFLGAVAAVFAWEMTSAPMDIVVWLQGTTLLIFSVAKVPQIVQAFQAKSTGQLDLFMVALQTLGYVKRRFCLQLSRGFFKNYFLCVSCH